MPNWRKLITSGSDAALNSLNVTSALTASGLIYPTADGTGGQVIVTDGAGNLSFDLPDAEKITFSVQNDFTSTLAKGTPIHITSTTNGTSLVVPASASNASTMPAHGILNSQLAVGVDGEATIVGQITGVDTSTFSSGDTVYVAPNGGYTNAKPQGSGNLIQNLGVVKKIDASNGTGEIFGTGRSNDVPNLPIGKIWVGSSTYSVTSSVAHLDESNNRLGINTNTPGASLDVIGDISGSTTLTIGSGHTNSGTLSTIAGGTLNTASAACSFIGGGESNSMTDTPHSIIGGGCLNKIVKGSLANSTHQFLGGGICNTLYAFGNAGTVLVGGQCNCACVAFGDSSFLGGGFQNYLTNGASVLVGGRQNSLTGAACGFIGGGCNNDGGCIYDIIVGGQSNYIRGMHSLIVGGLSNCVTNSKSVIVGGTLNTASAACSFIGGGARNYINTSAVSSSIVGGFDNITNFGNTHIIGSGITADKANYTFVNNLDVEGTVSASIFSGSFVGDGSGLTGTGGQSIIDGTAAANQIAVFNSTTTISGSNNLTYDGTTLDTNGNLDVAGTVRLGYTGTDPVIFGNPAGKRTEWNNPGYFEIYAEDTDSPGTFRETVDIDGDFNGGGFVGVYPSNTDNRPGVEMYSQPDNALNRLTIFDFTPTGGTGERSIDAAYSSGSSTHPGIINYTGSYLAVSSSYDNKITIGTCVTDANVGSNNLYVVGDVAGTTKLTIGSSQTNTGTLSSIAGGTLNTASADCSFIGGGQLNAITSGSSTIGGGCDNCITGIYDFIGGGISNCICNAKCSSIVGGDQNVISGSNSSRYHFIGGGLVNKICIPDNGVNTTAVSAIVGGYNNCLTIGGSTIVGGTSNTISGYEGFIGGGNANTVSGCYSSIVAGRFNCVSGCCSAVVNGCKNCVTANFTSIAGGTLNTASGACSFIGGGSGNTAAGTFSYAGGEGSCTTGAQSFAHGYLVVASGSASTAFGAVNNASNDNSFVGGGAGNTASGQNSFVGGGRSNTASGLDSFVIGYVNTGKGGSSFVGGAESISCNGDSNFVFGTRNCTLSTFGGDNTTIIGGTFHQAYGSCNFIGGGFFNCISINAGQGNTVFGAYNCIFDGNRNFIGGGGTNLSSEGDDNFIGGQCNQVIMDITGGQDGKAVVFGFRNCANGCGSYSFTHGKYNDNFSFAGAVLGQGSQAARGDQQFAFGCCVTNPNNGTTANIANSMVIGRYNVWNITDCHLFAVGNGSSDGSRANAFNVSSNGNVGIGTTSPRTKLHVTGLTGDDDPSLGASTAPLFVSNTANSYGLNIGVNNLGDAWLQAQSNTSAISYDILLNPLGGNVGIGCTSPQTALDVNGTTRTTALVETSARKYKKNIVSLQDQLDNIKKLKPVEFEWKETQKKDIGLIAEDVQKVYPQLVEEDDNGDLMGVKYSKITSLLIKAVQEQQEQIDELKKEIFILKQNK